MKKWLKKSEKLAKKKIIKKVRENFFQVLKENYIEYVENLAGEYNNVGYVGQKHNFP